MTNFDDLTLNSTLGTNGKYLVKSKKKEDALNASIQVWEGGLIIVVQYSGTNYIKITDGANTFSNLSSDGVIPLITSNDISDATIIGKALLTAIDVEGAREALDLGDAVSLSYAVSHFAGLDQNGHVPVNQMPISFSSYEGEWDADTNTPTLSNSVPATPGDYYRCDVAGTTDFGSGGISFNIGDYVIFRGSDSTWGKITASNDVINVNGKNGAVVLNAADVGAATQADVTNSVNSAIASIMSAVYPIGAVFISATNSMPSLVAAVGVWTRLEGRVIIGASTTYAAGSTGGSATHTLTVDEMPSHNHEVSNTFFSGGGGTFSVQSFGGSDYNKKPIIENRGGGQAHNNMQPWKAKYMWERVS